MIEPTKAFQRGESAAKRGFPRTSCPFSPRSIMMYEEWNKGWIKGKDFLLNGKESRNNGEKCRII